ncbi:cyclic nucleotide-binding/CBS domain-containing protein [Haloarcula marismortui]|uniref:CBS domain-containing protein n=1 Tax=Haloarcula marismortui TaxID=2238 RepID=UPI003C70AD00
MNSLDTPVEQVMTKPVKTVDRELSVRDVSKLLASEAVGSVVVETEYGQGILTKTDIITGLRDGIDPDTTPVGDLITTPVKTIEAGAPLEEAIDTMVEHSIKRLVIDGQTDGVGILTTTDVMQELSPDLDRVVEMFAEG